MRTTKETALSANHHEYTMPNAASECRPIVVFSVEVGAFNVCFLSSFKLETPASTRTGGPTRNCRHDV